MCRCRGRGFGFETGNALGRPMARKSKRASKNVIDRRQMACTLLWVALLGVWLLVTASLVSYDAGDWPGHSVAPHHVVTRNWVGRVGAFVSHKLYLMIGPGVWVAMAGGLAFFLATAVGRAVTQPILRLIGLAIMSLSTSTIIGLGLPRSLVERPEGPGGLIAIYVNHELGTRFGFLGTMIILGVTFWVGAILAIDQVVMALPQVAIRLWHTVTQLRIPNPMGMRWWPRLASALTGGGGARSSVWSSGRSEGGRTGVGHAPGRSRHRARKVEREDDLDDPMDEDQDPPIEAQLDDEDEPSSAADAPGAYAVSKQPYDPEALRAKIKQLPINFAPKSKRAASATLGAAREVDLSGYQFPELDLLEEPEGSFTQEMERIVRDQAVGLESAMQQYRIEGEVVGIDSGPAITLYEVRLAPGTKVSRLSVVSSDLARALKAHNIRIVPNMAGKDTVGIEVPNLIKERVRLKELMSANPDVAAKMRLPMYLGKDASGNPQIADLATMPHMLIAGTTGSGKSVCINSIIMSFLFTKRPDELKLVLVDPKMVELSMFKDVPHLMCPVVTEMTKAAAILEWATTKMDERYELLAEAAVRDISSYNSLGWEELKERFEPATEAEEARIPKKLPYLVFIIDELADMMMTHKEVEGFIVRIAQKARAVGIHLILATQRPQANVVTGLIKSNMPCRVSFKVASGMDSRIVLDHKGAELLLGQGDMLYLSPRTSKITRAQGTLVDDREIRKVVKFLKTVAQQSFEPQLMQIRSANSGLDEDTERDPLFDDAVRVVLESQRGSVSLLQRRLTVGYSRASRLVEQIAAAGIIGEYKGSQAREVNMTLEEWELLRAQAEADQANGLTQEVQEEHLNNDQQLQQDDDWEEEEEEEEEEYEEEEDEQDEEEEDDDDEETDEEDDEEVDQDD